MKFIPLLFLLLFLSCTSNPKQSFISEITPFFEESFKDLEEPGGSILIKKGNEIVFQKNFGIANIETKEKITENTIFNTGSISKTFVSNAILILQERKKLSIEDKLSKYFPDFKNPDLIKDVKIKHLLSHNSGIPDVRNVRNNIDFYMTAKDEGNFAPLKQIDSLHFSPGENYRYSNPAYNGLALIIEKVAKMRWQDFVKINIFEPAGMKDSRITNGSHPEIDVAHAYILKDSLYKEFDYGEYPTFTAAGNGGIWCSVLDLVKYEEALRKNVFLSKELTDESRTIFKPTDWNAAYEPFIGYSWFVYENKAYGSDIEFGVKFVSHTGSQGGFRAFHISIPEKDILYVALFNRPTEHYRPAITTIIETMHKYNWLD